MTISIDFPEGRQETKEGLSIALYPQSKTKQVCRSGFRSDRCTTLAVIEIGIIKIRLIIPILFPNWPTSRLKALGFDL